MSNHITSQDVFAFIPTLEDNSVDLFLTDPPYMGIVEDSWDNQWKTVQDYVDWMYRVLEAIKPKLKDHASVIWFGGIGKHGERPLFKLMDKVESNNLYTYRNMITWGKRRAYGKSHDYLFCREEFVWYSVSPERTKVTFNIPLTNIKRGYDGYKQDVKVGYSTIYCHTPHEDKTSPCMSPRSQAQSQRNVREMLRQISISQKPQVLGTEAQELGTEKSRIFERICPELAVAKSNQKNFNSSAGRSQKTRYSLQLDGKGFRGSMDGDLSNIGNTTSNQQDSAGQLSLGGSDRQLCWVCTWQYLHNVLEGQQVEIGCYTGGAGGSYELCKVALTEKDIKYKAKSEFKRVSNVWTDIPELQRPSRCAQKPVELMNRIISTHSNEGDLVVDVFAGYGTTGISALQLNRRFLGCEAIKVDAEAANNRCREVVGLPPI